MLNRKNFFTDNHNSSLNIAWVVLLVYALLAVLEVIEKQNEINYGGVLIGRPDPKIMNILGGEPLRAFELAVDMSAAVLRGVAQSFFPNSEGFTPPIYFIAFILTALGTAVSIAILHFPLKALSSILRILMEMEFTSRKANL